MNPASTDTTPLRLEVHGTGAAALIIRRIPTDKAERFVELQNGIVAAAKGFPGYRKVDLFPPTDREHVEWVVVIHFDDHATLQKWLESPLRAEWLAKFDREFGKPRLKEVSGGFNAWFTGQVPDDGLPPSWKIALSVLLPLYPTVVLLSLVLPAPAQVGLALSILVSNICSTCILQWAVSPALNRVLAPWLRANDPDSRRFTLAGLVLIVATLGLILALFRLVITG
jgi:antibiotic biosynthesis monooxygenase (ABM) superfamily enzyme